MMEPCSREGDRAGAELGAGLRRRSGDRDAAGAGAGRRRAGDRGACRQHRANPRQARHLAGAYAGDRGGCGQLAHPADPFDRGRPGAAGPLPRPTEVTGRPHACYRSPPAMLWSRRVRGDDAASGDRERNRGRRHDGGAAGGATPLFPRHIRADDRLPAPATVGRADSDAPDLRFEGSRPALAEWYLKERLYRDNPIMNRAHRLVRPVYWDEESTRADGAPGTLVLTRSSGRRGSSKWRRASSGVGPDGRRGQCGLGFGDGVGGWSRRS